MFLPSFRVIGAGGEGALPLEYEDESEGRLECARCCSGGLVVRCSAAAGFLLQV